ncbi:hypothetical protein GCM10022254_52670 [Actinomadura meridiana]|uniref:Histidine kinase/HSP90-like ATPase domain-containing protein n=1 Tax=Actinomadura meridiana TaxID=559626 RepID=A0ABP8CEJ5_9ACTN
MLTGDPVADIWSGGARAFQLARDPSCASQARALLAGTMRELRFAGETIQDAKLAVSELATNAHTHAPSANQAPPELWIWARTRPTSELVVCVFDTCRERGPVLRNKNPLDEHGKGLSIVAALCRSTGTHITRSRLTSKTGKCVWFALAVPPSRPTTNRVIAPAFAANRLTEALSARGIPATRRSDDSGISVINVAALNIWVEPKVFAWRTPSGYTRQPLVDLQETAERIVSHYETSRSSPSPT